LGGSANAWSVVRALRFSPSTTVVSLPNASWTAGSNTITFTGGTNPITQGLTTNMSIQGFTGLDLGRSKFPASITSTTAVVSGIPFESSGSGTLTAANLITLRTENATGTNGSAAPTLRSGNTVNGDSGSVFTVSGDVSGTGNSGVVTLSSGKTASGTSGHARIFSNDSTAGSTGNVEIFSGSAGSGNSGDINISTGSATGTRGSLSVLVFDINVNSAQIHNLADPTSAQDAATKNYVDTNSGIGRSVNSISSNTTLGSAARTDYFYFVTNTTTATLPTAVGNLNEYVIKNTGSGVVTIATTSSQTIDGNLTVPLSVPNSSLTVISDGANWQIV
jgi:hypothetical protein